MTSSLADARPENETGRKQPVDLFAALAEPDADKRAAHLDEVVGQWDRAMDPQRRVWIECDGMTYHDQFGRYDSVARSWVPRRKAPSTKVTRMEINLILSFVEQIVAIHTAEKLNLRVTASSSEGRDAAASRTADKLLWHLWEKLDMERIRQEVIAGSTVVGTWFVHPQWDSSIGPEVERVVARDENGQEFEPENLEDILRATEIEFVKERAGDAIVEILTAYECGFSPDTGSSAGLAMYARRQLALGAMQQNPLLDQKKVKNLVPSETTGFEGAEFTNRRKVMTPRSDAPETHTDSYTGRQGVIVTDLYIRATTEYPRGRRLVFAEGSMLYEGGNPRYHDNPAAETPQWPFPIFPFKDISVPGVAWGQGSVVRLIPPQKSVNGNYSKGMHIIKKVAHATLVHPAGIKVPKSDAPDQKIAIHPSMPVDVVKYLQSPQFPNELPQFINIAVGFMERIAGVNPSTQGIAPTKGASGKLTEALQGQDMQRRSPKQNLYTRQLAQVMGYLLQLFQRHADTERTVTIVGENGRADVLAFDEAFMGSSIDVRVYDDFARPRDPARRILYARGMVDMGLLNPATNPDDRAVMLQLLGGVSELERFEDFALRSDREKQRRENLRLYKGEQSIPDFWENDGDHLAVLFTEMNSEEWRTATTPQPDDSPEAAAQKQAVRTAFIMHAQHHLNQQQGKAGLQSPDGPAAAAAPQPQSAGPPAAGV